MSIERAVEPSIGISTTASVCDRLIAVCPPNCTMDGGNASASSSGDASFSNMSSTLSSSSGSKYKRSLVSKSVDTVSGLEFAIML